VKLPSTCGSWKPQFGHPAVRLAAFNGILSKKIVDQFDYHAMEARPFLAFSFV
jgi:hypothetical protein